MGSEKAPFEIRFGGNNRYSKKMRKLYEIDLLKLIFKDFEIDENELKKYIPDIKKCFFFLTPREEEAICMRFGIDQTCGEDPVSYTYEEIGQNFSVTRERARQIISSALRKLCHPRNRLLLQDRNFFYNLIIRRQLREEQLRRFIYHNISDKFAGYPSEYLAKSIGELDLSVRSMNVLKNIGIQTIGELIKINFERLLQCKNMGRKSLNEIKVALADLAIYC